MTLQEILDLAGHRDVPPWVVKLVADAVAKEREACAKLIEEYETDNDITATWLNIIADAIRARGQA